MAYATIMVGVGADPASDRRVRLAGSLAARFDAALIGIPAAADPPAPPPLPAEARARFLSALGPSGSMRAEWRAVAAGPGPDPAALVREARCADLLVVGGTAPRAPAAGLAAPVLEAGRPVLVVPGRIEALAARSVVVAWQDSRESRRALSDALPLLRRAERVRVLELVPDADPDVRRAAEASTGAVCVYLARHGVAGTPMVRAARPGETAQALVAAAQALGADLLVAGAHGGVQDGAGGVALGRVTHALLAESPLCCLLSH